MVNFIFLTGNIFIALFALQTMWLLARDNLVAYTKFRHAFIIACILLVCISAVTEIHSLIYNIIGDYNDR